MQSISVTLPGGVTVEVRRGTRLEEIKASGGGEDHFVAAKIDGRPVDLNRPLEADCSVEWISMESPDGLEILRHSTAHLMAHAVQSLFPGTQVTIGPTIVDGLYYDFKREQAFTPEELKTIESRMAVFLTPTDEAISSIPVPARTSTALPSGKVT
jgi:threonyl-tRNA synthetase